MSRLIFMWICIYQLVFIMLWVLNSHAVHIFMDYLVCIDSTAGRNEREICSWKCPVIIWISDSCCCLHLCSRSAHHAAAQGMSAVMWYLQCRTVDDRSLIWLDLFWFVLYFSTFVTTSKSKDSAKYDSQLLQQKTELKLHFSCHNVRHAVWHALHWIDYYRTRNHKVWWLWRLVPCSTAAVSPLASPLSAAKTSSKPLSSKWERWNAARQR